MALQSLNNRGEIETSAFLTETSDFYKELLNRANADFEKMSDGADGNDIVRYWIKHSCK